ncbi:hypothetical protein JCM19992_31420 [Thermostilla marina]
MRPSLYFRLLHSGPSFVAGRFGSLLRNVVVHGIFVAWAICGIGVTHACAADGDLWTYAKENAAKHRFSTLFTAHDVRDSLGDDAAIDEAIAWCKATGVTKVYIESFRSNYQAPRELLIHARDRFREAGFEVCGCVTTTIVGKQSTGWNLISCYTDSATQERIAEIFRYTAAIFDEIMIDDFWFTDCACADCDRARKARTVTVGKNTYPVAGDSWADYRCELMVRVSQEKILAAAKAVNPDVVVIIKYPQWYERFHERGYEVARETADFDKIWVGTETRDYDDPRWGGHVQYGAYFLMRWLGGIGGDKCGGGWFDPLGTTEATYIEQARQTVLGGAAESMLFCYGALHRDHGPEDIVAFRRHAAELIRVGGEVRKRTPVGVAAYRPVNADAFDEQRIFDYLGMMGLPLVPCHEFPADAQAAVFTVHAMKDPDCATKLARLVERGIPIAVTDGLARRLEGRVDLNRPNVRIVPVGGKPKDLLDWDRSRLDGLRAFLLRPLGRSFSAPNGVGLYLFADGSWVVENFNDTSAEVALDGTTMTIPPRDWKYEWK